MESNQKPAQATTLASQAVGAGANSGPISADGFIKSASGGHKAAYGGSGQVGSEKMAAAGRTKPQRERSFVKTKVSNG
jgi:hypothetical protein